MFARLNTIKIKLGYVLAISMALIAGGVTTSAVLAAIPTANGEIHGCYSNSSGALRVIDSATSNCTSSETGLNWSQHGPLLSNLVGANFTSASMPYWDLKKLNLTNANFSSANLNGADLGGATLSGVNFSSASLVGAAFSNNVAGVNFAGAILTNQNFAGFNLAGTILTSASLVGSNLSSATLFSNSDYSGTDFTSSNLTNDNFVGATFAGTSFNGANLHDAGLANAQLNTVSAVNSNFSGANLSGATISGTGAFGNSNFQGTNLSNLVFNDDQIVDFGGTDLTTANLTGVTWGVHIECPDNTLSGDHGDTCIGHLAP